MTQQPSTTPHTDEELFHRMIRGDNPAFTELYRRFQPRIVQGFEAKGFNTHVSLQLSELLWQRLIRLRRTPRAEFENPSFTTERLLLQMTNSLVLEHSRYHSIPVDVVPPTAIADRFGDQAHVRMTARLEPSAELLHQLAHVRPLGSPLTWALGIIGVLGAVILVGILLFENTVSQSERNPVVKPAKPAVVHQDSSGMSRIDTTITRDAAH